MAKNAQGATPTGTSRKDIVSSVIILGIIVGYGFVFGWIRQPHIVPSGGPPVAVHHGCTNAASSGSAATQALKVSDASGPTPTLNIFIGRGGNIQERQSAPLAIQKGSLCPGETLTATIGDLVRSDGQTLPANQVAVWGQVDTAGTHVTMWVDAAPRYRQVSGFGGYSGTVALADSRAVGGNVPVSVHVLYPDINLVLAFSLLSAFGGFTWALLVHDLGKTKDTPPPAHYDYFLRNLILRIAVLLAAAIPVVNAQVLTNPDWQGDLSHYITLATLAGAAAIALTPTLRALALPASLGPKDTGSGDSSLSTLPVEP